MMLREAVKRVVGPTHFDEVRVVAPLLPAVGTMIDVGAHYGGALAPYAERGWTVHAFEPDAKNRERLLRGPGRFSNVHVDDRAVSERSGEVVTFFTSDVSTGISSLTPFHSSHQATNTVMTITLADYLSEMQVEKIHLLKTDCEGHDLPVLKSLDWTRHHPQVVVCEFEDRKTNGIGYSHKDLAEFLAEQGYAVFVSEWAPILEYGQRHRWLRVSPWPAFLPEGAWGNFIAMHPRDGMRLQQEVRSFAGRIWHWRGLDALLQAVRKAGS